MKSWKLASLAVLIVLFSTSVASQNPIVVPGNKFGWDQGGSSLSAVQAYTYRYYLDGAVTGTAFSGVTCTGIASPYSCLVQTPIFSQGNHTIQLTAANQAGESLKSNPFAFDFVAVPNVPTGLRIVP